MSKRRGQVMLKLSLIGNAIGIFNVFLTFLPQFPSFEDMYWYDDRIPKTGSERLAAVSR